MFRVEKGTEEEGERRGWTDRVKVHPLLGAAWYHLSRDSDPGLSHPSHVPILTPLHFRTEGPGTPRLFAGWGESSEY